jgi:ferredoxin
MRAPGSRWILGRAGLDDLIGALRDEGYEVIGPVVKSGAIVHGPVTRAADLPVGLTDRQEPGSYRLSPRDDQAVFGFAVGPDSYKEIFYRSEAPLVKLRRKADAVEVVAPQPPRGKVALLGARACEIAAIGKQDRILLEGPYVDEDYAARRRDAFVVALQCSTAGGTCFCVSMGTGPQATGGFDLAITELLEESHRFVVEIGTERGGQLAERLSLEPAAAGDVDRADAVVATTASRMGRHLDTRDIRDLLYANLEHPRWDEVASRCLSCTNCTLVCPTCFCADRVETTTLDGTESAESERARRLDSCFSLEHSHVHGGPVHGSVRSRYRQWLTHKLAGWIDQFGSSGCVGCGRCLTWCPVGIDITEEVAAIRADDSRKREAGHGVAREAPP